MSHSLSCFLNLYGQAMGYNRRTIHREVSRHGRLTGTELNRHTERLFQLRVRASIRTFSAYAEKVRNFRGRVPEDGAKVVPEALPIWTKEDQKALFASLNGPPVPGSFVHATGGSTGVPVRFYMTRESYEWRTAVSDRGYSWAGAEEGRRSFYVWGSPIYPPSRVVKLKRHLHHWLQRRRYFDSFVFDDAHKEECCRAIGRYRPEALVGYAGNLIELACFVRDNPGTLRWRSRTVLTAAEGLAPGRRALLEEHLGGEVFMSYGSREFMLIGMECPRHNGYHVSSDNLLVEVVDEKGMPTGPGVTGRILVTDLHNDGNPFVRYEIGDLGAMSDQPCPCGLPFPMLTKVEGRLQEVIYTATGQKLTALFIPHLMKEFEWVDGYQMVQEDKSGLKVCLVTKASLEGAQTEPIRRALLAKLGEGMRITFVRVDSLSRNHSGKTPIVMSTVRET